MITRINKAFSDIQMQIITIPASLIAVGSSLKIGKDYSFVTNSVILLGALFFSFAVLYMCENQKDTLNNIKYEIDAQKNEFIKDPLFENNVEFNENFNILQKRYATQINNLNIIKKSVIFSIVIILLIYFYFMYSSTCLIFNINFLSNYSCK